MLHLKQLSELNSQLIAVKIMCKSCGLSLRDLD